MQSAAPNQPPSRRTLRSALAVAWILSGLAAVAFTLWMADYRYAQPTPQPSGWRDVPLGASVTLPESLFKGMDGPLLVHSLNPDCPCSRFVLPRASALAERCSVGVTSVVLVLDPSAEDLGGFEGVVRVPDPTGAIAAACGLYSTPAAALLDGDRRLLFAGNYTTTRYCSDSREQPLERVLRVLREEGADATLALGPLLSRPPFGCPLPVQGVALP
ncbi:MAG: hypothetical protein AAGG01_09550 [Planctomycetota bacterium]